MEGTASVRLGLLHLLNCELQQGQPAMAFPLRPSCEKRVELHPFDLGQTMNKRQWTAEGYVAGSNGNQAHDASHLLRMCWRSSSLLKQTKKSH